MAAQHIVGVDAEWKPISRASPEVALIQIATFQKIYLIDAISLTIDVTDWNQLAKCVFNNNQILKIGNYPLNLFKPKPKPDGMTFNRLTFRISLFII